MDLFEKNISALERREMNLKQFIIDRNSFFLGKNIKESGIRDELALELEKRGYDWIKAELGE